MLKVTKFGGTSMADAGQYRKVREIIQSDSSRRVVVVSAAGKRDRNDHKITDLLYLCHAHTLYGVECDRIFEMITSRYLQIRNDLGIQLDLEAEFAALKQRIDTKTLTQDELVSRGEYFSARLMAAYLGFQFVDAAEWVRFRFDGSVDQEASYEALRQQIRGFGVVTPGFYGRMPDGRIRLLARGGSDITGKKDFSIISMSKWGMSNQVGVLRKMLSVLERHGISINYAPNGIDNVSVVMPSEALAPPSLHRAGRDPERGEPRFPRRARPDRRGSRRWPEDGFPPRRFRQDLRGAGRSRHQYPYDQPGAR